MISNWQPGQQSGENDVSLLCVCLSLSHWRRELSPEILLTTYYYFLFLINISLPLPTGSLLDFFPIYHEKLLNFCLSKPQM